MQIKYSFKPEKIIAITILLMGLFIDLNAQTIREDLFEDPLIIADSNPKTVIYNANLVFQYGGESKITILPKINLLRIHKLKSISPYYGIEFGIHPLLIAGAFTFSAIGGIEKGHAFIETSISHFRTTKIPLEDGNLSGSYSQNLWNLKIGFRIKSTRIKFGTSLLLSDHIPNGEQRIGLLDIGKIQNNIYGIEVQFKIK